MDNKRYAYSFVIKYRGFFLYKLKSVSAVEIDLTWEIYIYTIQVYTTMKVSNIKTF